MLRFSLLDSGSSGNAALVRSGTTSILIDNGLSLRKLRNRMEEVGERPEDVRAVFVTHEHSDHVLGLGVLCRTLGLPVYLTEPTYRALPAAVGELPDVRFFESGETVTVGDLRVGSFQVAHDAVDPVNFTIESNGAKLGFATDLGHSNHLLRTRLSASHALVLESNYCPDLLRTGAYPAQVQQRIRSRIGHLSNQDMGSLLDDLLHDALQMVVLVHISENNNTPERVREMAERVLRGHPARLHVALRNGPTPVFEVCP